MADPQDDETRDHETPPGAAPGKTLTPQARRALEEAAARRSAHQEVPREREIAGRDGPDPARFGDWEVKGIATDF